MKNTCQTCGSVYEGDMCYTCCVVRLSPEEIELDRLRSELSMLREERDAYKKALEEVREAGTPKGWFNHERAVVLMRGITEKALQDQITKP